MSPLGFIVPGSIDSTGVNRPRRFLVRPDGGRARLGAGTGGTDSAIASSSEWEARETMKIRYIPPGLRSSYVCICGCPQGLHGFGACKGEGPCQTKHNWCSRFIAQTTSEAAEIYSRNLSLRPHICNNLACPNGVESPGGLCEECS